MPDLTGLIRTWWKQMLAVVLLSMIIVGVITFMKPRKYLSVATAVPASSFVSDRSRVFNENIQTLYSTLGTTDDLDMIVGTGGLDTVYFEVAKRFNLFDHYKMKEKGDAAIEKAASLLKGNTRVTKTGYGELKVKVWDTDNQLAPQLANAIMDVLQSIHQKLQSAGNEATLNSLKLKRDKIKAEHDSINQFLSKALVAGMLSDELDAKRTSLKEQRQQYEKLIGEYELMVSSKPPVLIVEERAKGTSWPDKPKRMQIMIATLILSSLFSLLVILVLERRKISGS